MNSLLADLPKLGQLARDGYRTRLIWNACPGCGKERWVRLNKKGQSCRSCVAKERVGDRNPFYGKHHTIKSREVMSKKASERPKGLYAKSEAHKEKVSEALKGRKHSPGHIEHNRLSHIGSRHSEEWKRQHSLQMRGRKLSEEQKQKLSLWLKGHRKSYVPPRSAEHRKKLGEASRRRWLKPGFAEKVLAKIRHSAKPTKPERFLQELLDEHFPGEWKYVGDGKVIIERKNPDFINCNGRKMLIEVFGEYWHKKEEEQERRGFFLQYGFQCLILWQHELKVPELVIKKIKEFCGE